jgi:hypothetical protein
VLFARNVADIKCVGVVDQNSTTMGMSAFLCIGLLLIANLSTTNSFRSDMEGAAGSGKFIEGIERITCMEVVYSNQIVYGCIRERW